MSWQGFSDKCYYGGIGFMLAIICVSRFVSCAAKTTGIDASKQTNTEIEGTAGDTTTGDDSPVLQPTAGEEAIAVAGPSGETAAVGTGAQVTQVTTGNIALGGGWLAVIPLVVFTLLVARRRRLAVDRVYRCGRQSAASAAEFDKTLRDEGMIPPLIPMRGGRTQIQDAPGRVIARAVRRVTKK